MIEDTIPERIKKAKKAVHGGDAFRYGDVVDFSSNVNPFGPSKKAMAALRAAVRDIQVYPDPDARRLKEAIGDYLGVALESVTVGNGSTEVIKNFCEVFIRPGDRVLLPVPTFSEYRVYLDLYGAEVEEIPLAGGFGLPLDGIKEGMEGARALFLCNPNNPTGRLIPEEDLEEILGLAGKHGTLVFVDEAYIEFTEGKSLCRRAETSENLFVLRSLTKFFSLAALRVGFGVSSPGLIKYAEKVRIPWNVNALAIEAAVASLNDADFIEESRRKVKREREFLKRGLERLFEVVESDAHFFLVSLESKGIAAPELKAELLKKGILIRDCSSFESLDKTYFRVSIQRRGENRLLLKSLEDVLEARHD
jgi:threonine-phosphate decarboxylase